MLTENNNRKMKSGLLIIALFVFFNNNLLGQNDLSSTDSSLIKSFNKVYSLDPLLYNGVLYSSFYPGKAKGNQYFTSSDYQKGDVVIRGVLYKNLDLNYDIYKQELLLKYFNSNNVYNIIAISKAWLEEFTIGKYRFKVLSTPEAPTRFYQVLGNSSAQLYIYWEKKIEYENDYLGNTSLYFLTKKEFSILKNNTLSNFKDNKSFVKLFTEDKQVQIKKYLRQNKINITTASDQAMIDLINYCSKL